MDFDFLAFEGPLAQRGIGVIAPFKREAEEMEVVAVATCLCMLKKEVDRRRLQQAICISAAAGA